MTLISAPPCAVDMHSPFFHLQAPALLLLVPEPLLPNFSPLVHTQLLSCALSLCLTFPLAGRCEAFSKHGAGPQQCFVSRRKLPNVPTHSSEIFQRSFPSFIHHLHGMESEIRRGELACPAHTAWTQCGAVVHPAYAGCITPPLNASPCGLWLAVTLESRCFSPEKSCSWILGCVYIPSRYAMWKCLEIGNSVPAEWVKGMRLKKKSLSSFPRDLPNSSFLCWFAHPADVSAQISLLVFSSYTVCQAQTHIHLHEELVQLMIREIPTVGGRAWGRGCDQVHTHVPADCTAADEHTMCCYYFSRRLQMVHCWGQQSFCKWETVYAQSWVLLCVPCEMLRAGSINAKLYICPLCWNGTWWDLGAGVQKISKLISKSCLNEKHPSSSSLRGYQLHL